MRSSIPLDTACASMLLFACACRTPPAETRAATSEQRAATSEHVAFMQETRDLEGTAHGFPQMRTVKGEPLGDGEFRQWLEGNRLHVWIRYELASGGRIEELSVLRQEPQLVQEQWSWTETRGGEMHRTFAIDFVAGVATAEKQGASEHQRWSKRIDVEPGRAFAGFAWALAIRSRREELLRGETVSFQAVGFTPKPTVATVEITHRGVDRLPMSGREIEGERYRVHPKVPWIAKPFVEAPDSWIWLTHPAPAAFLRYEGALAEPDDDVIRIDLLPGGASEKATPIRPAN